MALIKYLRVRHETCFLRQNPKSCYVRPTCYEWIATTSQLLGISEFLRNASSTFKNSRDDIDKSRTSLNCDKATQHYYQQHQHQTKPKGYKLDDNFKGRCAVSISRTSLTTRCAIKSCHKSRAVSISRYLNSSCVLIKCLRGSGIL